ncbi:MAG: dihydroorotase [Chitinophagaceae bacterium]
MPKTIIKNVLVVNEGKSLHQDVLIQDERFERIASSIDVQHAQEINGEGLVLLPGLIDDQVHFREPGLTHKATIGSESMAAVAGGVTSFMEMPNVVPPTLNVDLLNKKNEIARASSFANYSFFLGVGNDTANQALEINNHKNDICGLKIFMGSSTGNMLVDNIVTLEKIFSESQVLIATHCESEGIIKSNKDSLIHEHIDINHASFHPIIRNEEACFESSLFAIQLAKKYNTRLHILHISTARETELFSNMLPLHEKRITSEVCVHHLHFTSDDYATYGNLIKCNPAIKSPEHKEILWKALLDDKLDIIATDHAPHTWDEKSKSYLEAPAGVPLVQHSLQILLESYKAGRISLEKIVEKASHAPAICFNIFNRGFIKEGYFADAVLVNLNQVQNVTKKNILYKANWSPFEGHIFPSTIVSTWVNGTRVFHEGNITHEKNSQKLSFDRI